MPYISFSQADRQTHAGSCDDALLCSMEVGKPELLLSYSYYPSQSSQTTIITFFVGSSVASIPTYMFLSRVSVLLRKESSQSSPKYIHRTTKIIKTNNVTLDYSITQWPVRYLHLLEAKPPYSTHNLYRQQTTSSKENPNSCSFSAVFSISSTFPDV